MATELDAKLRLTADATQASKTLAAVGKQASDLGKTPAGGGAGAPKAIEDVGDAAEEAAKKLKATQRQLNMVAPQLTDIVTQLAGGQNPMLVMLQQGGQLRDVFGGFGNALKAVGSVLTPMRLAIGGVAGAIGAVAYAAIQGAAEQEALRKALALTGNAAGLSGSQVDQLAAKTAASANITTAAAREIATAVASSGEYIGATVDLVTRAVGALTKLSGQTSGEALKQLDVLTSGVAAGAAKLNKQYNFLTAEQYRYVQSLAAQGREQEAIRFVTNELAQSLESRTTPSVYSMGRAWDSATKSMSDWWTSFKDMFKDDTVETNVARLEKQMARLQQFRLGVLGRTDPRREAEIAQTQGELDVARNLAGRDAVRNSEGAIAKKNADEAIFKAGRTYQDSLAAITQAGNDKVLAITKAGLDKRQAALEQVHALGLMSEEDYIKQLGQIELKRAEAIAAAATKKREIEQGRVVSDELSANQREAAVASAQAAEIAAQAAVAKVRADFGLKADAEQLGRAQRQALDYAAVWTEAARLSAEFAGQVAQAQAALITDPVAKARAAADAAIASMRQQLKGEALKLDVQIGRATPEQAQVLRQQLEELLANAQAAMAGAGQKATFESLMADAGRLQATLQAGEQAIATQVQQGLITTAEGEERSLALRKEQVPELEKVLALVEAIATSPEQKAQLLALKKTVASMKDYRTEWEKTAKSAATSGISDALMAIETGAKTGKQALLDMVSSFAKAMLDVLNRKLAEQLVAQFADAAASSGGGSGGSGSWMQAAMAFFGFHTGGVVGQPGGMRINASPLAFLGAPRYHSGGIAGLAADEVPAILRKGEEVLTEDNPRHRNNARSVGGVQINNNMTVSGSSGDDTAHREAMNDLARSQEAAFMSWALKQQRPGGIFAR